MAGRYHHGDLPRALVDAALAIIADEGIGAMTLRGVARRAGVSHAAPLHHFRDLEALHRAIAAEGFEKLAGHQRAMAEHAKGSALDRFRAIGIAYVDFAEREPAYFRAMFHPRVADSSVDPTLAASAGAVFDLLLDAIRTAQAEGQVTADDPKELALVAWSTMHGLAALLMDGQLDHKGLLRGDARKLAAKLTNRLFLGLRP
jgi:AcrR family transcriptional regulator